MDAAIHQEMPKREHHLGMPHDDKPMEGKLQTGEAITLHGNIKIGNQVGHPIEIKEEFLLTQGGYHVHIFDLETGERLLSSQSPMHSAYFFIKTEQGYALEKLEPNNTR